VNKPIAMRDALLRRILQSMKTDEDVFFISADFGSPVLDEIRSDHPDRFINVGVAEQNLINVSAGLALEGYKVFSYAIAPFITMRCFEQLRVNLALLSEVRNINVNLIGVGAGYSYVVSGPTHQCYEDISLIRSLPNFRLFSASDHHVASHLFDKSISETGPKYLRLDAQILPPLRESLNDENLLDGFQLLRTGDEGLIVATGYMTHTALSVLERLESSGVKLAVLDLFDLTGFDETKFLSIIKDQPAIFTMEEGFRERGGLDSVIGSVLKRANSKVLFESIGVTPGYSFELGTRQELHELVGIGQNFAFQLIKKKLRQI
jgi:transketolase